MDPKDRNLLFVVACFMVIMVIVGFAVSQFSFPPGGDQADRENMDIFDTAIASGDKNRCDEITDPTMRQSCNDILSISLEEPTQEQIDDNNRFDEAIAEGDISLCEDISDPTLRQSCRDMLSVSPEEPSEEQKADMETFDEALARDDPSLCDGINDPTLRQSCRDILGG